MALMALLVTVLRKPRRFVKQSVTRTTALGYNPINWLLRHMPLETYSGNISGCRHLTTRGNPLRALVGRPERNRRLWVSPEGFRVTAGQQQEPAVRL